jgi:site-specific recombinase XerD
MMGKNLVEDITVYQYPHLVCDKQNKSQSPASQYLITLESKSSRKTMAGHLNSIARIFGVQDYWQFTWEKITSTSVYYIRERLVDKNLAPATINTMLCAIRQTCKQAFLMGLMSVDEYQRVVLVPNLKASRVRKQTLIKKDAILQFKDGCDDNTLKGLRDFTLFLLLISCGLRRAEVIKIKLSDIDFNTNKILILGKGDKQRNVWMPEKTAEHLIVYLSEAFSDDYNSYIFVPFLRNDEPCLVKKKTVEGLALSSVNYILAKRAKLCGVHKFKPHDLRGTYATTLLNNGEKLKVVAKLLGHSSIKTTQIYHILEEEDARKAAMRHNVY